jgi:hypothetical protein
MMNHATRYVNLLVGYYYERHRSTAVYAYATKFSMKYGPRALAVPHIVITGQPRHMNKSRSATTIESDPVGRQRAEVPSSQPASVGWWRLNIWLTAPMAVLEFQNPLHQNPIDR